MMVIKEEGSKEAVDMTPLVKKTIQNNQVRRIGNVELIQSSPAMKEVVIP